MKRTILLVLSLLLLFAPAVFAGEIVIAKPGKHSIHIDPGDDLVFL